MNWEEEDIADRCFFEFVELGALPPNGTFEGASGQRASDGPYETSLVERCETAWRTPYRNLSCAQVSTLVAQKMGLQWLGRPALEFARRYPAATIQYYPGEMVLFCLRAAEELATVAQPEFAEWLRGDFGWMEEVFGSSRPLLREAQNALSEARRR